LALGGRPLHEEDFIDWPLRRDIRTYSVQVDGQFHALRWSVKVFQREVGLNEQARPGTILSVVEGSSAHIEEASCAPPAWRVAHRRPASWS
jgi:hypothetical protein